MRRLFSPRPDERDALARLTLFGWSGGLALCVLGALISFVAFGLFVVYWRNADMDLVVVYNALRVNGGLRQTYFDHPGLVTIHSLAAWFRLLHGVGLLGLDSFAQLPSASDPTAFAAAMSDLVRAGRLYSLLLGLALAAAFAGLARKIVADWRVALLGTFALIFSGGWADHIRILRTELLSAGLVIVALLLLIAAARTTHRGRVLMIGLAALLAIVGLVNKVQAIVLIAALPLIVLPFGTRAAARFDAMRAPLRWLSAIVAIALAAAAAALVWPLIQSGFDPANMQRSGIVAAAFFRPGAYQAALIGWTLALMIGFAVTWRVSPLETVAAIGMALCGGALGLCVLYVGHEAANAVAALNPLEKMWSFAIYAMAPGADPSTYAARNLLGDMLSVLARYTFVLHTSPRPAVFLTWLIVPGIVIAWRRGDRPLAVQCLFLLGASLVIDTLGIRRGLKLEYFIYTDPLLIVAAMLLGDRLRDFRHGRIAYALGVTIVALHIVLSQAEPVKHAFARSGPEGICAWNIAYMPQMPVPFCPAPQLPR